MRKILFLLIALIMIFTLVSCISSEEAETPEAPTKEPKATDTNMHNSIGKKDKAPPPKDKDKDEAEYIVLKDRIIETYVSDAEGCDGFIEIINNLCAKLPEDINQYLMISPFRIEFEEPEIKALGGDMKADIQKAYFAIDCDINPVDSYFMISQHTSPLDDIYYRLDHHWTQLGAYYAAEAFFQAAEVDYHKLDEYEKLEGEPFWGYLYAIINDVALDPYPDKFTYYKLPGIDRKTLVYTTEDLGAELTEKPGILLDPSRSGYYSFVEKTRFAYAVIEGEQTSERSLLVVGDSTMNALSTWLSDSFKTVVLIDPRYYDEGNAGLQQLIIDHEITDFLSVNSADSLSCSRFFNSRIAALID